NNVLYSTYIICISKCRTYNARCTLWVVNPIFTCKWCIFFFFIFFLHFGRGLYYSSYNYPRNLLWFSGIIIYFLMMASGFLGYVLPWGQMSYRAATVITNFLTVIPVV